jgi:hypothetical protein
VRYRFIRSRKPRAKKCSFGYRSGASLCSARYTRRISVLGHSLELPLGFITGTAGIAGTTATWPLTTAAPRPRGLGSAVRAPYPQTLLPLPPRAPCCRRESVLQVLPRSPPPPRPGCLPRRGRVVAPRAPHAGTKPCRSGCSWSGGRPRRGRGGPARAPAR